MKSPSEVDWTGSWFCSVVDGELSIGGWTDAEQHVFMREVEQIRRDHAPAEEMTSEPA